MSINSSANINLIPNFRQILSLKFISGILIKIIDFGRFILLVRLLGQELYGAQALFSGVISLLIPITSWAGEMHVVKSLASESDPRKISRYLVSICTIGLIAALAILGILWFGAGLFNRLFLHIDGIEPVVRLVAFLILIQGMSFTTQAVLKIIPAINLHTSLQLTRSALVTFFIAITLYFDFGLFGVFTSHLLVEIGLFSFLIVFLLSTNIIKLNMLTPSKKLMGEMFRFGMPLVTMGISVWMISLGDRIVIGYFLDANSIGQYNAIYTMAGIFTVFASPLWSLLYPIIAKSKNAGDLSQIELIGRKFNSYFAILCIPALVGITLVTGPLLKLTAGTNFDAPDLLVILIAAGLFLDNVASVPHYLTYVFADPGYLRNIMILGGIVNFVLNVLLIPQFGIIGASIATLISYLIIDGFLIARIKRYGFRFVNFWQFKIITTTVFSATLMAFAVKVIAGNYVSMNTWLGLIFNICCGALVYLSCMLAAYKTLGLSELRFK